MIEVFVYFLIVCAAFSLTSTACRSGDWRRILHETQHLLVMVVVGIATLAGIVFAIENVFLD
jgi:hypothetical protein